MIIVNKSPSIFDKSIILDNYQYFGNDVYLLKINEHIDKCIKENMFKECTTSNGYTGIIIGFEDNSSVQDYYFIVYCPEINTIVYELINNKSFIDSIH